MTRNLDKLLDFVKFTHQIRNVQRALLFETNDRHENDAEHGYQLALVCWYVIEDRNLNLDRYKCIGMALVHDIVEVYAGDTFAFADKKVVAAQSLKEKEAIQKLKQQWPSFTSLADLIDEYEGLQTAEAKFVYAMDKLVPIINNYLYGGKAWRQNSVTLPQMKAVKVGKIDLSPEVNEYYKEILITLEKRPDLFGKESSEKVA